MQQVQTSDHSHNKNFDKKAFNTNEKPKDIRKANILAAKGKKNNLTQHYLMSSEQV
jgi:hypothetical protein